MADIQFDIPQRYDMATAAEGVFIEVVDKDDNYYGKFKCRHIDQDSPAYKRQQEKVAQELQRNNRNVKVSEDALLFELFIRAVLVDWEGVTAGGKPVAFNEKNARAYFSQPFTRFVRGELMYQAQEAFNFKLPNKVDVAGN